MKAAILVLFFLLEKLFSDLVNKKAKQKGYNLQKKHLFFLENNESSDSKFDSLLLKFNIVQAFVLLFSFVYVSYLVYKWFFKW